MRRGVFVVTLTYIEQASGPGVTVAHCDRDGCERSAMAPMRYPWIMVTTHSRDGQLVAEHHYCSLTCLAKHLVVRTPA